ncbi:MAG: extracellular solute-binding protein [Oscillospiraceae bacterium]|nr:extracellular solute-binding protein [Oscillospiraceae bacterium]
MKQVKFIASAAVLLSTAILSSCMGGTGISGDSTQTAEQSADTGKTNAAEQSSAISNENSGETVHLEYFNVKPEVEDIYNTLIAKFEKENPDIVIEQINDPDPTTVLQTRMSTNNMPDILSHWATDPVFKEMVNNEMLLDLTDQEFLANVKDGMLETVEYNGKAYCLPISMNAAGVFYNKDIFTANQLEVPSTYEEFIQVCQKLQTAGITPLAMFNQSSHAGQTIEMLQVEDISNFEQVFADIQSGSKSVADFDGFRITANKILELNKYAQDDSFGSTYEQAIADFANGSAAMIIGGIWMLPTINEDNDSLNYSTFALPASEDEKTVIPYQNDHCLAISSTCEHPQEALKFLAFMAEQENAQYYADMDGSPSYINGVETTVTQTKPLLDYFNDPQSLGIWPDQIWNVGVIDSMNSYADELVQSGDVDAYLSNIQTVLQGQ